jgi:hypothetical protein
VLDEDGFRELLANGPALVREENGEGDEDNAGNGDTLEDHQEGSPE